MTNIKDNQGEHGGNSAYMLWVDGKASKISSDRQCLIPHANQALNDGFKVELTYHSHYQEAYKILLSGITFHEYMGDVPNPNRFIKSSFALSLLWTAKYFRTISDSYKRVHDRELAAFHSYNTCFRSLLHILTGHRHSPFRALRLTDQWVRNDRYPDAFNV